MSRLDFRGPAAQTLYGRGLCQRVGEVSLRGLDCERVAASISYSIHIHGYDWNYLGPGDAWFGADVGIVRKGQGRLLVSALRIIDHLGKDPVADKLLLNMIDWSLSDAV